LPRRDKNWLDPVFGFLSVNLRRLRAIYFPYDHLYLYRRVYICAKYVVARLFEPTDKIVSYLTSSIPMERYFF